MTRIRVGRSGPSIRAALAESSPEECESFEEEFAEALALAGHTFDLSALQVLLERWWGIAVLRAPLSPAEHDQLARTGDFTGSREDDRDGGWRTP